MSLIPTNSNVRTEDQVRARRSFWLSLILGLTNVITASISAVSGIRNQADLSFTVIFIPLFVLTILSFFSAYLSRHGRHQLGISLIIGFVILTLPVYVLFIEGIGIAIALIGFVISLSISLFTLDPKYVNRVIIPALISGVITIVIDLFGSSGRVQVRNPVIVPLILLVMTITFIIIIIFQFKNLSLIIKILLIIVGANLLTAVVISYYSINNSRQIATSSIGADLKYRTSSYAVSIGDTMARASEGLGGLIAGNDVQNYLKSVNESYGSGTVILSEARARVLDQDAQWQRAFSDGDDQDVLVKAVKMRSISA